MSSTTPTVGIAVLTYHSHRHLRHCLPPLVNSPLKPKVLIVDSSSHDGTVEEAQRLGAETLVIPSDEFNHGKTRDLARKALGTDIVVMVTHDAYAVDANVVSELIKPIVEEKSSIAYARQIPHAGAGLLESFHREFNYPETSHIRSIDDLDTYGAYTFFCSDAFCAYSNKALDSIGGFPAVLIGEDTCVAAMLLKSGHHIAYVAEALVNHSHRYNLNQEFRRHFDTGLARQQYKDLIKEGGADERRGATYVYNLTQQVAKEKPSLLPYTLVYTLTKWLGYRLGKAAAHAPLFIKRACSGQSNYWKGEKMKRKSARAPR